MIEHLPITRLIDVEGNDGFRLNTVTNLTFLLLMFLIAKLLIGWVCACFCCLMGEGCRLLQGEIWRKPPVFLGDSCKPNSLETSFTENATAVTENLSSGAFLTNILGY